MPRPTRISVHLETPKIDLPADAPAGHPHIINFDTIDKNDIYGPGHILNAVDSLSTVLYKWNPEAFASLLDMSKASFHFGRFNFQGYETYVARKGNKVSVGSLAKDYPSPDFEVQYSINEDGIWKFTGGREGVENPYQPRIFGPQDLDSISGRTTCYEYDGMFATHLYIDRVWETDDAFIKFRWEVDGRDMINSQPISAGTASKGNEVEKDGEEMPELTSAN